MDSLKIPSSQFTALQYNFISKRVFMNKSTISKTGEEMKTGAIISTLSA